MLKTVKIAEASELAPGDRKVVEVDGRDVALFRIGDEYYAIDDVCTHDGGPLADGELDGTCIECPRHGARFDVRTGAVLCFPAVEPVPAHPVEVRDDGVYIRLDD
ncbi:non-heme iron oxygenase ferredoxin subunit [Paludisphaera rhizosphaerae]|uniref:non-heme iron oxygenase ferredoxin subunit n=1 Tax=Paludisphaera rhizosphaerae TaxID=2711216 RepID=UPI0013ED4271|nr:non-heme iron oxygenase ferredoxin subunit [Paludisphaera rhizosphaerae]